MRGILTFLVAALCVGGGCRNLTQSAALPGKYKLQADQLVFNSDFVLPADHRIVRELTAERGDLCRTLGLPCANEQIDVYLFSDAATYSQFLSTHFANVPSRRAFFLETDSRLVVYAHWGDRMGEDLRHEVAHGYLHSVAPSLPLWLDEGLAEFFEVPRGHGGMNPPHLQLLSDMARLDGWRPNLAELEQITDASQMQQQHYAEAWAWVYYMLHSAPETREILTTYLADIRARGKIEPLSDRLAAVQGEPQHGLTAYLASLGKREQGTEDRGRGVTNDE